MDENPYESPEAESPSPESELTLRAWLRDRVSLLACGCLSFFVIWTIMMLMIAWLGAF